MEISAIERELNTTIELSDAQIAFFQKNNFIKIKEVLSPDTITHFNSLITAQVDAMNSEQAPLDQRDTYGKAFLQLFNLWEHNTDIQQLVFSRRLANMASQLMKVDGVRLYHDQALFKEAGGGITPWHADQYYWPLNSDKTITAWIPLQDTPLPMGPLEFSAGSQQILDGRNLGISDGSERQIQQRLKVTDFEHVVEPFDAGEISFHSGWIFHRAGANTTQEMRKVMTVIYMDKAMRLKNPENDGQRNDWETWCPGAEVGNIIDTPKNPILD